MVVTMRTVWAVAVPTLAVLLGFVWYVRKKPSSTAKPRKPPDKKESKMAQPVEKEMCPAEGQIKVVQKIEEYETSREPKEQKPVEEEMVSASSSVNVEAAAPVSSASISKMSIESMAEDLAKKVHREATEEAVAISCGTRCETGCGEGDKNKDDICDGVREYVRDVVAHAKSSLEEEEISQTKSVECWADNTAATDKELTIVTKDSSSPSPTDNNNCKDGCGTVSPANTNMSNCQTGDVLCDKVTSQSASCVKKDNEKSKPQQRQAEPGSKCKVKNLEDEELSEVAEGKGLMNGTDAKGSSSSASPNSIDSSETNCDANSEVSARTGCHLASQETGCLQSR